jgi:hypothetical protein
MSSDPICLIETSSIRVKWRGEAQRMLNAHNLEKPATPATLLIINQINRYIWRYRAATYPLHFFRTGAG